MSEKFRKGDKVTRSSHGGMAEGDVLEEITSDTEAAGRTVRASDARRSGAAADREECPGVVRPAAGWVSGLRRRPTGGLRPGSRGE